jgi:hypothetical protein
LAGLGGGRNATLVQMPHDCPAPDALNPAPMTTTRAVLSEITRALAVLALVFLSFAHQPAVAAEGHHDHGGYDFCGTPPVDPAGHAPCHACRSNPVVLPPAPAYADPVFCASVVCVERPEWGLDISHPARSPANPRAPPALA